MGRAAQSWLGEAAGRGSSSMPAPGKRNEAKTRRTAKGGRTRGSAEAERLEEHKQSRPPWYMPRGRRLCGASGGKQTSPPRCCGLTDNALTRVISLRLCRERRPRPSYRRRYIQDKQQQQSICKQLPTRRRRADKCSERWAEVSRANSAATVMMCRAQTTMIVTGPGLL